METAIFVTIVEYINDLFAHNKAQFIIQSRKSCIENTMNVSPKEDAIGDFMATPICIRLNMSCFQSGKDTGIRKSTLKIIGFRDFYAEPALAKARLY